MTESEVSDMEEGKEESPELSIDEVLAVAKREAGTEKIFCRFRTLVKKFESARLFLAAKESDYRRLAKYGSRMDELITRVKERCFFIRENDEERYKYDIRFKEWLEARDKEFKKKMAMLDLVFKREELEFVVAMTKGIEFIDVEFINKLRCSMTLARQEHLRKRWEELNNVREKMELEELDKMGKAADGG